MPPYQGEPKIQTAGRRPVSEGKHQLVYAPERTDVQTQDLRVRGRTNPGRSDAQPVRGAPQRQSAMAPYFEVYDSYAREAEDALAREDIPRPYQRQVRDYFRAIQPDRAAPPGGQ
jgi:small-conductance mechanosensitive channel